MREVQKSEEDIGHISLGIQKGEIDFKKNEIIEIKEIKFRVTKWNGKRLFLKMVRL